MAASRVEPVRFTRRRGAGRAPALPTASRLRPRHLDLPITTIMRHWSCWVLLFLCGAAGFLGWLGLRTRPQELGSPPHDPFEMTTGDKRFQAEATHWEMSPPDSCHHQVMMQLHLSEEDEEEAAKLGLDLFNCQASAEGHQTKPRTLGMEELRQPALDETIIAGRQHRMAQLVEDIAQQIRNMSSRGATGLREGHQVVLSNLDHVQERARHIYSQIESDLALLLARQRRMEEVMEKLRRANHSLRPILVAMEGARSWLENRLQHLHAVFYPTGQNPSAISTCVQHGSYFVLLVALLVATPPRAILLPLFLTSSILGKLLGIPALSTLLAVAVAGHWLVLATRRNALEARSVFQRHRLTSTPNREHNMELLQEELDRMEISCLQEPSCLEHPSSQSLANDVSSRSPCQGLTKAGQRCRKTATPGQNFCHVHTTARASCSGLATDSPSRV